MSDEKWPTFKDAVGVSSAVCPYLLSKSVLGTGSYANVYECKDTVTGKHYAAKRFSKKLIYGMESMLQREFSVLKTISRGHPNILSMVDYFETSDYFYLVTDLAAGGELFERITKSADSKLPVTETQDILSVLLSAIKHLHSNRIVHRDIKAENILFVSRRAAPKSLLLADFGQARVLGPGETAQSVEGTLSYLAPEVLSRTGHSFPVDMWAVGVLTYFMLCGYMPFDCDTDKETKELISTADFVFEPESYWCNIPSSAKDFIAQCFKLDPEERLTASDALSHPFIAAPSSNLKPTLSHHSLQHLQEAVLKLHQARQKSSSHLSLLSQRFDSVPSSVASPLSLDSLDHALQGDKCHSPETVTTFTTPVPSASVSRMHSSQSLQKFAMKPVSPAKNDSTARSGNANFML